MLGREKICAVAASPDEASMYRQLDLALGKTGTVELRLDWLEDDREIERFLATRVFLELFVRVRRDWSEDPRALKEMGYD